GGAVEAAAGGGQVRAVAGAMAAAGSGRAPRPAADRARARPRPRQRVTGMSATGVLACLCTCPDEASARTIASTLVEERLAACVNLLPRVHSVYRWHDAVEHADELLLVIKTTRAALP